MAQSWASKAPTEIVEREWTVPVGDEDSVQSYTSSASGVTIDSYERNGDTITFTLSSGTDGATGTVTLSATTKEGLVHSEVYYIAITEADNALAYTARDICYFALRKVVGTGEDPTAGELDDALERFNDMLARWAAQGADTRIPLPAVAGSTLYVSDSLISALKHNLAVEVADLYDRELSANVVRNAMQGLQQVKLARLSDERSGTEYF